MADWQDDLKKLLEGLGMKPSASPELGCVKYEKEGLSVETRNHGETFEITHGKGTLHSSPSIKALAEYLSKIF